MNDRCGCVRAHGYDLTGKMTGGGLRSVAWASAITLDSTSVIALAQATECNPSPVILPVKSYPTDDPTRASAAVKHGIHTHFDWIVCIQWKE